MPNVTRFDPHERYICLPMIIEGVDGTNYDMNALLDTGAPATEFSDEALQYAGFLEGPSVDISLKPGPQTQKYGKIILPHLQVCSHPIAGLEVYVSHFEKSWGIDALIGLDFFRRFRVTIDYQQGQLLTEPFSGNSH